MLQKRKKLELNKEIFMYNFSIQIAYQPKLHLDRSPNEFGFVIETNFKIQRTKTQMSYKKLKLTDSSLIYFLLSTGFSSLERARCEKEIDIYFSIKKSTKM